MARLCHGLLVTLSLSKGDHGISRDGRLCKGARHRISEHRVDSRGRVVLQSFDGVEVDARGNRRRLVAERA